MPVDISDILHVLAHELRTPVGIAHGYVRLLLEDRLPQDTDRRRVLEQMQKALTRLSDLSHESTALAAWYEREAPECRRVAARALLDRVGQADYDFPVTVDIDAVDDEVHVHTSDESALGGALISLVRATARELRGVTCDVRARTVDGTFEVLMGPEELLPALSAGPGQPEAGALGLERGGLGLALVHAAAVLDAHGAERWTMKNSRQAVGVRLPLDERPHP